MAHDVSCSKIFFLIKVKAELERVKASMIRLKQIQDKPKRNLVDQDAAKRFVASSLWKPGQPKNRHQETENKSKKRPSDEINGSSKKNKKK